MVILTLTHIDSFLDGLEIPAKVAGEFNFEEKMKKIFLGLLAGVISCAPIIKYEGNTNIYDPGYHSKIISGKTKERDLILLFGEPQIRAEQGNKKEMMYKFVRTEAGWSYKDAGVYLLHIFLENNVVTEYKSSSSGNYKRMVQ